MRRDPEGEVTNPARRDSFLDSHVIVRRDRCAARMERRPPGVWGRAVEIQGDRIIRQWSRQWGWVEEPSETQPSTSAPLRDEHS